ncbi:MAG: indole-3-glycerol phosphate synthase TrpC [Chloroflexota bacterium]
MSDKFVKTDTILDKILETKVQEVARAKVRANLQTVRSMAGRVSKPHDFIGALRKDDNTVALIAEIKKASPSRGVLIEDFDHLALGRTYAENGASAISVLTDEQYFQGHLRYLEEVDEALDSTPLLRKDFVIDPYQVYEARMARASAVLLIVAALDDAQLSDLHTLITELGMAALVEVHNEAELERALKIEPKLIGINNRDLKTFNVDVKTTERIAQLVPDDVTLVAESGLKTAEDVAKMGQMGAHAVLIGEGLVTADDIGATVRSFSSQSRN